MFERFTEGARRVLVLSQDESRRLGHPYIGTEHLLLGLVADDKGVAGRALAGQGVTLEQARAKVAKRSPPGRFKGSPPFTPRAKQVLELGLRQALSLDSEEVGEAHVLLGLLQEGKGGGMQALGALGVDPAALRDQVLELMHSGVPGALNTVGAAGLERGTAPAGDLVETEGMTALLGRWLEVTHGVHHVELDGVPYESHHYRAAVPAEVTVAVVGAAVSRQAFDDYSARLPDAEPVAGVGDAATWSTLRGSLRVLSGSTAFVVRVTGHTDPRAAAVEVAAATLANLAPEP